ncbi:MAG: Protein with a bacterial immunoglobulin-like domain protein [Gammaproteobacteria bacterium]|nr:Protein with a bacterial immunoglobulin-like domain protein [Gammaproteobacteria bacterium]
MNRLVFERPACTVSLLKSLTVLLLVGLMLTLSACDDDRTVSLKWIEISPSMATLSAGTSVQLSTTAIYSNNTHADVTGQASWSSSGASVATVDGATGKVSAAAVGAATITASFHGQRASAAVTVTAATLVSIAVTPTSPSVATGSSQAFKALGTFTDNTTQDLTADVAWSSSDSTIAIISNGGVGTGIGPGKATITATCSVASTCGSVNGSATLTVTAATLWSIAIAPRAPGIALGTTQQLQATGTYTDQSTHDLTSQVTWTSSSPSVATVSSAGLATSLVTGTSSITAAFGGVTSSPVVLTVLPATLVSIALTPTSPTVAVGLTQQFTATGTFSDHSTQDITGTVTWTSGTPGTATVSNASGSNGLVTALTAGSTQIEAALGSITSSPETLTVIVVNTTISASVSSLALSVSDTATSTDLTGTPRVILITNTGTTAASDVLPSATGLPAGTNVSSSTCAGVLAPGSSCTITIAPGATPSSAVGDTSPTPISLTVSGTNTNTISVPVVVLTYGSVYQSGYVYSIDDTTPSAAGIGGRVMALTDQSPGTTWSPDYSVIWGIDETSTPATPSPVAGASSSGMSNCAGAGDGSCNTSNIVGFYSATTPATAPMTYAAGVCTQTISGYADWYLPAVCEMGYDATGSGSSCGTAAAPTMQNIQSNLVDKGTTTGLSGWYLSSTEYSATSGTHAWASYTFSAGTSAQAPVLKSVSFLARCVRALTP